MSEINFRIQAVRQNLSLSRRAFGEPLAASDSVIKNLENNLTEPKPAFIDLLCRTYNVNRIWLETGEGEMFADIERDAEIAMRVGEILAEDDDSFKKQLIGALVALDDDEWELLRGMAEKLIGRKED